jgi:hypothetical protein
MIGRLLGVTSAVLLGACAVIGIRTGTEEPPYASVERFGPVEIRRYGPRLAAETIVTGPEEEARSAGFRRLARFIFGANTPSATIAMTAPVAQQRIAMTAPVAQEAGTPDGSRIRFFMPAHWTAETLPQPTDRSIAIVTIPPETYARGLDWTLRMVCPFALASRSYGLIKS